MAKNKDMTVPCDDGFIHENYFRGDAPKIDGKLIYKVSFFFYMKVPEDFEPVSSDFTDDNSREHIIWVSPDTPMTIYPEFFRSELSHPEKYVKHIVTKDI
ncbi:MAG: hypothetical protein K6E72_09470 [Saccharofermentans sp.]|nr:hypothetical protein [Saccharofermentans sp.]